MGDTLEARVWQLLRLLEPVFRFTRCDDGMTTTLDADRMHSTPQLAADLGHLLDRILNGGEQDLLRVMAVHEMTPLHVRVLRELACCPLPLTVEALADRIDLD